MQPGFDARPADVRASQDGSFEKELSLHQRTYCYDKPIDAAAISGPRSRCATLRLTANEQHAVDTVGTYFGGSWRTSGEQQ